MALDPRTPVLVGAAAVSQRVDQAGAGLEPVALMAQALERAAEDAGAPGLLARASSIRIPRGFWDYPDPGRLVRERLGAARARTEVAEIGVLQTTLLGRALTAIARGEEEVVLVTGGEAKHRDLVAARAGTLAPRTRQAPGTVPDRVLRPHADLVAEAEVTHGLVMPVAHYAVMENALRAAEGTSLADHRAAVAALWAAFSRVAASNPDAWLRTPVPAAAIAETGADNRMLAFPYAKRHTSQWNVDQAAGLVLCSVAAARAAGLSPDRWIFPLAITESNHVLPLAARPHLSDAPGFRLAGERALALAGLAADQIEHLELYSCFPVAVRMQQRALGLGSDRPCTVTGGMPFAGGPLNNFVLQAMARMVAVLRAAPGTRALVTAVSGMLTKQGVSLWASAEPTRPCRVEDVSEAVAAELTPLPVTAAHEGEATIASYTVLYEQGMPARAIAICDLPAGGRAVASSTAPEVMHALVQAEGCGRRVVLGAAGMRLRG